MCVRGIGLRLAYGIEFSNMVNKIEIFQVVAVGARADSEDFIKKNDKQDDLNNDIRLPPMI